MTCHNSYSTSSITSPTTLSWLTPSRTSTTASLYTPTSTPWQSGPLTGDCSYIHTSDTLIFEKSRAVHALSTHVDQPLCFTITSSDSTTTLSQSSVEKDLGVIITCDLKWNLHHHHQVQHQQGQSCTCHTQAHVERSHVETTL